MSNCTLKAQTEALYEEYSRILPKEIMHVIDQATEELVASGIGEKCLKRGDIAPMFCLPDANGNSVCLDKLLNRGPVVLTFYRGGWCTFCNLELKALQDRLNDIHKLGAELVAVTPQKPDGTKATLEEHGIEYPILTDSGNIIASEYGVKFEVPDSLKDIYESTLKLIIPNENDNGDYSLPVTATYIISTEKIIVAAFTDPNFVNRMEPQEIVDSLITLRDAGT